MGVGVQRGLDGKCSGEGTGVPLGVLTSDGCSVSLGTKLGVDGCSDDHRGIGVSSPRTLSSPLSKGEIIVSTGITLLDFLVRSVGSYDSLLISLSLFSCSKSSYSCSLSLC